MSYSSKSITCSKRVDSGPQPKVMQACSSLIRIQANALQIAKMFATQHFWPSSETSYLAVRLEEAAIIKVVQNALARPNYYPTVKEIFEQVLMGQYWSSNSPRIFRSSKDQLIDLRAGLPRKSLYQYNDVPLASYNPKYIQPCILRLTTT